MSAPRARAGVAPRAGVVPLALTVALCALTPAPARGELLGTWLPNYGDVQTNFLTNASVFAAALDTLVSVGANTLYIDAWHDGVTAFPSAAWEAAAGVPWSSANVTDVLSFAVPMAKARGLRVVVWLEYGCAYGGLLQASRPYWSMGVANGFAWMDPSLPEVQALLVGIAADALAYAPLLDGVQYDDHFCWPNALPASGGPSQAQKQATMTALAGAVAAAVRAAPLRPGGVPASFSLAPNPLDTSTADYNVPWDQWLHGGVVDDAVVQLYCYDASYFLVRLAEQVQAVVALDPSLAARVRAGILLNNGAQVNANGTAMMREAVAAAAGPWVSGGASLPPIGGQAVWYVRGVLLYETEEVKEIWTNATASRRRTGGEEEGS
jgi:uncharacterized lipoprotein YddW (UPF0748 family)